MTETQTTQKPRRMALHTKILLGLVLGAIVGVLGKTFFPEAAFLAWVQTYLSDPLGKIFLNLLIMVVIPLVFSSLVLGVAQIGDMRRLGRMGLRTTIYFFIVTSLSVIIGLTVVNTIRPGDYLPQATKTELMQTYANQASALKSSAGGVEFGVSTIVNIIPRNPFAAISRPSPDMLALIFCALIFGVAITLCNQDRLRTFVSFLEGVYDITVKIIEFAMRLAPYGVAALIFSVTSRFGFALLLALSAYVITVISGLTLHFCFSFSVLLLILARYNPIRFFSKIKTVILTAFSTSSSAATLPTTILVAQNEFGIPSSICSFVLTLGATMNMNGTALFEGVTVLFLAQVFGVDLPLGSQIVVVVMSVLTAIGAAGVPAGSLPLLIIILQMMKVPPESIALILGVDRFLDMCRTTLNVTGDMTCAAYIARSEKVDLK